MHGGGEFRELAEALYLSTCALSMEMKLSADSSVCLLDSNRLCHPPQGPMSCMYITNACVVTCVDPTRHSKVAGACKVGVSQCHGYLYLLEALSLPWDERWEVDFSRINLQQISDGQSATLF